MALLRNVEIVRVNCCSRSACVFLPFENIVLVSVMCAGPAFSRLDRLLPIGPRAKGDPALRLVTYAKFHFLSKLLVQCSRGAHNIF